MLVLSLKRKKQCLCGASHTVNTRGDTTHFLYKLWKSMMHRCYNMKTKAYYQYGGRAIYVEKSWHIFSNFVSDMEKSYQRGLTLERQNNNGSYSKNNCKWASRKEQANNRRSNVFLTFQNRTQTLYAWSQELEISHQAIQYRLKNGWSVDKALGTAIIHSKSYVKS